jgi:hypothetical protein
MKQVKAGNVDNNPFTTADRPMHKQTHLPGSTVDTVNQMLIDVPTKKGRRHPSSHIELLMRQYSYYLYNWLQNISGKLKTTHRDFLVYSFYLLHEQC